MTFLEYAGGEFDLDNEINVLVMILILTKINEARVLVTNSTLLDLIEKLDAKTKNSYFCTCKNEMW